MIVLSIVLAVFVYFWSRELFGIYAAIISLVLYGLDPTILAHSAIIHTDLPFAAVFFIGAYFLCRALREFSWVNLVLVSFVFGLAAITKHSFFAIAFAWFILGSIECYPELAEGYYNLGRILFAQGRVDQAIESFRGVLRVKSDHADAHHGLAQALARQGKTEEAAHHYQEALRILRKGT
jgi:tetratricopeptide (TPR) repeat protein